ncbi:glucose PTS transporter subunit IIA [Pauljensenia sp. UMB0018B]|uniref:PTS beta-glucoside transporter subunit EIIBCA n=1 Tax=Schaalia odontolytica TaxID=1660 RepID=A0A2I1HZF2_9ACTO|nr:glucose PTS transporter subunit IIA [Schaalia odontolytica]MDK7340668.1 glucose PTS transporter subunit IIA [Pauljensenia sp. UMB0018B]PKY64274.1 PTS beta-glucoside transporter subunit EIIBCA [Schaalia odontolytica]
MSNTAQEILDAVGGPGNITHFTHCATRLRFELNDASIIDKDRVEAIDGVLGAVPQSGDRYQIVIGGAVQSVFNEINNLPSMKSGAAASNDDVKAAARAKARGKNAIVDAFFEYLSDSFRPLLPVLLGASLILAFLAVLDSLGVVDTRADVIPAWLGYVNSMWRAVFYFLPAMVAYNASKKLDIDPWVGTAVILSLLTPNFLGLSNTSSFTETTCTTTALGSEQCVTQIGNLPLQLADYGGQVFVPLLMVPILAVVYKGLKKIIPSNVQMVFVPFISFMVIMPLTAFLIGPLSIWIGNGLGGGLAWLNGHAPIVFAIIIPIIYPFLVPLGLHWPLNALQLANIASTGSDFIQGPMGAWNFACFGATAGVLFLSIRDRDTDMRQTASGALAAGLFGGISEPSLYGIHLRFKRIYPLMLTGCVVGGLVIGIGGGATTNTFVFTSLLTIPVFTPMAVYGLGVAAAFFTAFLMVVFFDYRTKEQKAEARAKKEAAKAGVSAAPAAAPAPVVAPAAPAAEAAPAPAFSDEAVADLTLTAPMAGELVALSDVADEAFAAGALGPGIAVSPAAGAVVVAPCDGKVSVAFPTGHAYGIKSASGVQVLIHIGMDTVKLEGKGFTPRVAKGDVVKRGDVLAEVDWDVIREAGYDTITPMVVTNKKKFGDITPAAPGPVGITDTVVTVSPKEA